MQAEGYALQWDRTHLLFVPPFDPSSSSGAVVQVTLRSDHVEGDIPDPFPAEQASVTRIIETLLVGHVNAMQKLPRYVRVLMPEAVSGCTYTLIGVRKPWKYGYRKHFFLGDIALQPAEHKWIFHLQLKK